MVFVKVTYSKPVIRATMNNSASESPGCGVTIVLFWERKRGNDADQLKARRGHVFNKEPCLTSKRQSANEIDKGKMK
jgi:hypothetical protein